MTNLDPVNKSIVKTLFVLSGGRSGTAYLASFFRANVRNCISRHEPYFAIGNPTLFGKPIYYNTVSNFDKLRPYLALKKRFIEKSKAGTYFEANHAFLKAAHRLAPEYFPEARYIHAIRNPIQVAKSEANREEIAHKVHFPFRYYQGEDGNRYFRWSLTGKEPIYQACVNHPLTRFQHYVIQWVEIENRAMELLNQLDGHHRCFTLHTPMDLNNPTLLKEMVAFFDLKLSQLELKLNLRRNPNPRRPTVISDQDRESFRAVIDMLPDEYQNIFQHKPYSDFPWATLLKKGK